MSLGLFRDIPFYLVSFCGAEFRSFNDKAEPNFSGAL